MHADSRHCGSGFRAIYIVHEDHRIAFVRRTFAAGADNRATANATLRIDEHRLFHGLPSLDLAERRAFARLPHDRQLPRMNFLDPRCASLELRDFRSRIERRVSQLVRRQLLTPVIRDEDRVRSNRANHKCRKDSLSSTRDDTNAPSLVDLEFHRTFSPNLAVRPLTL